MGRRKGSGNRNSITRPATSGLSTEARIEFVANLIVDRILAGKKQVQLFKKLGEIANG